MKIIIVGTGAVGSAICSGLAEGGHSITVIDKDAATVEEISAAYDVTGYVGNGCDIDVMHNIGADKADIVIAITQSDELNMLCCLAGKKLGAKHTIARVRNPEYASFTELVKEDMGLSLVINPDYLVGREISRVLRLPSATKVDTFCRGRVEAVEFTVPADSVMIGKTMHELRSMTEFKFLVVGIKRGSETFIPLGKSTVEAGDIVTVITSEENTAKFFKAMKSYKRPVKNVLIAGGGRTTYYIADLLRKTKTSFTVIEKVRDKCEAIANDFPQINVIHGDGTHQQLLLEEGIERADAFLALGDTDEENAISSMFAKTLGVPKTITMIRSLPYIGFFHDVGLDGIVSPKSASVEQILRFVRSISHTGASEIVSLYKLMDEEIEALEFAVKEPIANLTDIPLYDLKRKDNTLIACIVRGGEIIIPSGNDMIRVGDSVIIVTLVQNMISIKDIIK